jgi:hypothetical protein
VHVRRERIAALDRALDWAAVLLVLKLLLVPGLIAFVSLGGRRWGPRVAGLLTGLPLVAGPVLLFLAIEQGPAFAARAALSTLAALVGVAGFCVVYGWASLHLPWTAGLVAGWAAFALAAVAVHAIPWRPWTALAAALLSFAAGRALLPRARAAAAAARWPAWDLWLRMALAVALVLITTSLAARLGPALSGVLTPFPVAISVLAAFAHAQQGSPAVLRLLGSLLPSMGSFAAFCWILAVGLEPLGVAAAFALALGVQLVIQALLLAWLWWTR